ncbi:hypothetical protein B0H13DRAFT_2313398 [Mycena leptocephala]|nr:hypothetical protein B0H13DRAFT_2313398 [Mycena leptocephala]
MNSNTSGRSSLPQYRHSGSGRRSALAQLRVAASPVVGSDGYTPYFHIMTCVDVHQTRTLFRTNEGRTIAAVHCPLCGTFADMEEDVEAEVVEENEGDESLAFDVSSASEEGEVEELLSASCIRVHDGEDNLPQQQRKDAATKQRLDTSETTLGEGSSVTLNLGIQSTPAVAGSTGSKRPAPVASRAQRSLRDSVIETFIKRYRIASETAERCLESDPEYTLYAGGKGFAPTVHAPETEQRGGKTLPEKAWLFADPNVGPIEMKTKTQEALASRQRGILKAARNVRRYGSAWLNNKCEQRNDAGVVRDARDEVESIDGFRRLKEYRDRKKEHSDRMSKTCGTQAFPRFIHPTDSSIIDLAITALISVWTHRAASLSSAQQRAASASPGTIVSAARRTDTDAAPSVPRPLGGRRTPTPP